MHLSLLLAFSASLLFPAAARAADCPTTLGPDGVRPQIDITNCGINSANPYDGVDDSGAIQHANDQIATIPGGGYVYFPPDTDEDGSDDAYLAHNVSQDSNVEFYGTDRQLTFIKHSNPDSNENMIAGRVFPQPGETINGSIAANSTTLTVPVTESSNIAVGSLVGVKGAGGRDPVQSTTLASPMLQSGTLPIVVNNPGQADGGEDWATLPASRFLQVGNEIVGYSNRVGNTFYGVERGKWSAAAAHPVGAPVGQSRRLVAEVVAKVGNQLTLSKPAVKTVTMAPVAAGSANMTLRGLTLDGNGLAVGCHPAVEDQGAFPNPASYSLARWVTVTDVTVRNGDAGGITFSDGTRDSVIENSLFEDNGDAECLPGAHTFLFGGAIRNVIKDNILGDAEHGRVHFGIFVDDRSEHSREWDSPSDQNELVGNIISDASAGIRIDGSSNQSTSPPPSPNVVVTQNQINSNGGVGITVGSFEQGIAPRKTTDSSITLNTINNASNPCLDNGVNNTWASNTVNPPGASCPTPPS